MIRSGILSRQGHPAAHSRKEPRILILAGDADLCPPLVDLLGEFGTDTAGDRRAALDRLDHCAALRVFVLVDGDGVAALEILEEARRRRGNVAVLMLSRAPTVSMATDAIRHGAEDFVPIPYSPDVLRKEVVRILDAADLRDRVEHLRGLVDDRPASDRIVSQSPAMRSVFARIAAASRSDTPVIIFGETGTGKDLTARAIHATSRRGKEAFVPINCAALPRDLVESELFGHRRGAFSGAYDNYPGLFMSAHHGTLFLDEISELPFGVQAKLLRVVQDGEVRPVGGLDSRHVDVRIIAASNRTSASLRESGLREDLFYRLSVLVIDVPPLRERLDDLPLLASYFLAGLRERGQSRLERLDEAALDLLSSYSFPGNVRELENLLHSVAATAPPERTSIAAEDVRGWLRRRQNHRSTIPSGSPQDLPIRLSELEAWAIAEALRRAHGNKRMAAQMLGISRDTLYRKLEIGRCPEIGHIDNS
jgi:DNA-binding NtrC family response regulator